MVSVRRVKYIVKLSVVSLIIFSIILFNKLDDDISYKKKVRRYFAGKNIAVGSLFILFLLGSRIK